jgi:hypothetical protein
MKVEFVADIMRRHEWEYFTARKLAAVWEVQESTVNSYAQEASRMVLREVNNRERVSLTLAQTLDRVIREALQDGDRRSAIDACRVWAQLAGANAPDKHEVLQVVANVEARTADELRAYARELARGVERRLQLEAGAVALGTTLEGGGGSQDARAQEPK